MPVSTTTPSRPPANPTKKAFEERTTGTVARSSLPPRPKNTCPRTRTTASASKGPRRAAGTLNISPSITASTPTCNEVAPLLLSMAISTARDLTTSPVIKARKYVRIPVIMNKIRYSGIRAKSSCSL